MTQIKIEVPANDTIALSALGAALSRIAAERTPTTYVKSEGVDEDMIKSVYGEPLLDYITSGQMEDELNHVEPPCEISDDSNELQEAFDQASEQSKVSEPLKQAQHDNPMDSTLDADGLPWDKRIHSRGKSRLADDTWRLARKPADKSQEEWDEYVNTVKAELKAVQSIAPPSVEVGPFYWSHNESDSCGKVDTLEELHKMIDADGLVNQIDKEQYDKRVEIGYDDGESPVTPPVIEPTPEQQFDEAVLPPVETVTPPVVESKVSTFPEMMKWITSDGKKRGVTNDMIKETLVEIDPALTGLPLIATRADLIPTLVEKLKGKL